MTVPVGRARIGDLITLVRRREAVDVGQTYKMLGVRLNGQGAFLREVKSGDALASSHVFRVHEGDFIYSRLFASGGAFATIPKHLDGCCVSSEFPTFNVDASRMDQGYLLQWLALSETRDAIRAACSGSTPITRNRLKENEFLALTLPLPALARQRALGIQLGTLAGQIARTVEIVRSRQGLTSLLSDSIATVLLQMGTSGTHLGDFAKVQSGYAFRSATFSENGVALVRNANIGHGKIDWRSRVGLLAELRPQFERFELAEGDILVSLDRPIISTGLKVARVTKGDLPALLVQRVGRVAVRSEKLSPDFLFEWLRSPHFIGAIDPGRSNGVPHISPKDIERIPFSPPPIDQQYELAHRLQDIQRRFADIRMWDERANFLLGAVLKTVVASRFRSLDAV